MDVNDQLVADTVTVDIITRKPTEFAETFTASGSVGAVHSTLPGDTDPQINALLNFRNEASTFGVLVQAFSEDRTLRRDGYRILTAANANEALELLALNQVQVIISDQRMPGTSGTEFLGVASQLYPDTMRIILSGYTDLKVVTDSVNRGAVFKFLTKQWDDDLLREQVRDAFRRFRPDMHH